jgi:Tfp pilus assembly pilus retraction ATPase PilT
LRDLETMSIAVTAAEMGILVMGTLHTNGAAPSVDRMVNVFPSDKQSHVRTMLSTSLRGVVSQQLLQRADRQGRGAALEILVNTPACSYLIRQGKLDQLENVMQSGAQLGMRTMDSAIQQLLGSPPDHRARGLQEGHQQAEVRGAEGSRLRRRAAACHFPARPARLPHRRRLIAGVMSRVSE